VSDPAKQVVQVLYPALRYDDARAAIRWLGEAFGFLPTLVVDGEGEQVAHARLELDGAVLMLGSASESGIYPAKTPRALGGSRARCTPTSPIPTRTAIAPAPQVRRSRASPRTPSMDRASMLPSIRRGTGGRSGRTGLDRLTAKRMYSTSWSR